MLLRRHHDNENHFGITKTREALIARLNIANNIVTYINSCAACLRNKSTTRAPAGFLHSLPIPRDPFADIAMDFIGPIPRIRYADRSVNKSCLYYTRTLHRNGQGYRSVSVRILIPIIWSIVFNCF